MKVTCSVCGADEDDLKVVQSRCVPNARFVGCAGCREANREPRPLVVIGIRYEKDLGFKKNGNKHARRAVKYRLYAGDTIEADEVLD